MRWTECLRQLLISSVLALLLAGCGGGGSSGGRSEQTQLIAAANTSQLEAYSSQTVNLSGSSSTSAAGRIQTYAWTVLSGPAVSISNADSVSASLVVPPLAQQEVLRIRLTITDSRQAQATADLSIAVRPAPIAIEASVAGGTPFIGGNRVIELAFTGARFNGVEVPVNAVSWNSTLQGRLAAPGASSTVNITLIPGTHNISVEVDCGPLGTVRREFHLPVLPDVLSVSPAEATPMPGSVKTIPVVMVTYIPTADGINIDLTKIDPSHPRPWRSTQIADILAYIRTLALRSKFVLEEGSRFHGYKDPTARPYIGYRIVAHHVFYEPFELSGANPFNVGQRTVDVGSIINRVAGEDYVNDGGVSEFWVWGYYHPNEALWESNMSSAVSADISNSDRADDLPRFDRTYVVYGYNYMRSQAEAIHNHGHQIEAMLSYWDGRIAQTSGLFWTQFVGVQNGQFVPGRCGATHFPLNAVRDYDYLNASSVVQSDCEDWQPDGGPSKQVSLSTWAGIPYSWPAIADAYPLSVPQKDETQWYLYWMQNLPGLNNNVSWQSSTFTNWWELIAEWDETHVQRKSLLAGVLMPPPAGPAGPSTPPDPEPVPGLKVGLQATARTVAYGEPVSLFWQTSRAEILTASGEWSGAKAAFGTERLPALTVGTHTFTLTGTGEGDTQSSTVQLTVQPRVPRIEIKASPAPILQGQSSVFSWESFGATSCALTGAATGSAGQAGSRIVGPLQANAEITVNCAGPYGSTSRTANVTTIPVANPAALTSYTDPTDPRRLAYTLATGDKVVLVGELNATETAVARITGSSVKHPDGSRVDYSYDGQGRISGMAAQGVAFSLAWNSSDTVTVGIEIPGVGAATVPVGIATASGGSSKPGTALRQAISGIDDCVNTLELLSDICSALQISFGSTPANQAARIAAFCGALSAGAAGTAVLAPYAPAILAACTSGILSANIACHVFGLQSAPQAICGLLAATVEVLAVPLSYELEPTFPARAGVSEIFATFFDEQCFAPEPQTFRLSNSTIRLQGNRFEPTSGLAFIGGERVVKEDCHDHREGGSVYIFGGVNYIFPVNAANTIVELRMGSGDALRPMCGYKLFDRGAAKIGVDVCMSTPNAVGIGNFTVEMKFFHPDVHPAAFVVGGLLRRKYD